MSEETPYHDYCVRVGYADTDRMGFVHHSRYLVYMESARTEMLRATGSSYKEWEDSGILLPLTSSHIDYLRPALYDDFLRVRTRIANLTRLRIRFDYEIFCDTRNEQVTRGFTEHVFMNKELRPIRAGEEFRTSLKPFLPE